jgi:membrane-associated phospholipid phosphatase
MADPFAPSLRHQLGLAASIAGGVALVSGIIAGLGADEHWPIDARVRATLARKRHPRIRASLDVAGRAGTVAGYGSVAVVFATAIAYHRDIKHAAPVFASAAVAAGASALLKRVVRRPRPERAAGPVKARHSFPSGHATRATATALTGAYLLVRERLAPAEITMPFAAAVAIATGVSRTYADDHWTTDVIGGWALGAAVAAGAALWYEAIRADSHDD